MKLSVVTMASSSMLLSSMTMPMLITILTNANTSGRRVSAFSSSLSSSSSTTARASSYEDIMDGVDRNANAGILTSDEYITLEERAGRNIETFDDWAINMGGIQRVDGVHLTYTNPNDEYNQQDVSMMTDVDLPAGSPVMAIPAAGMIISSTSAKYDVEEVCRATAAAAAAGNVGAGRNEDCCGLNKAVDLLQRLGAGDTIPKFYLFVKLVLEYSYGTSSSYYPYLDALPRLYYNSVSMTDFCYECLPPLVFQLSRRERVKFDNFYDAFQQLDPRLFDGTSGQTGIGTTIQTSKETILKWAFNVVHTRCFSGNRNGQSGNTNGIGDGGTDGEEQKIVIMADMFNHGTETDVELMYDDEGNCNVYTVRDVPAGSPLRISYGCPTNPSEFFATYGFLDESSPATFCKIMNIPPTPELRTIGLDFSRMLFYKDTGDISPEVWDVLLYANVLKNDLGTKQAFYEAHVNGDGETKNAIHSEYFGQTARELQQHVDMFLEQLQTLSSKSDDKDWNDHPRLPLILRHNEFVRSTFENVKARLDPMVAEYD